MVPLAALCASAWVALVVLAPGLKVPLAAFIYVFGSVICHQISERSFHVDGAQLPVCARCFGIYAGFAASAVATTLSRFVAGFDPATRRRTAPWLVLPTLITVAVEWAGLWQPSNLVRAIAGAPLGIAVALVVTAALKMRGGPFPALHYEPCVPRRLIAPDPPTTRI